MAAPAITVSSEIERIVHVRAFEGLLVELFVISTIIVKQ
jgi:hypothetical protein